MRYATSGVTRPFQKKRAIDRAIGRMASDLRRCAAHGSPASTFTRKTIAASWEGCPNETKVRTIDSDVPDAGGHGLVDVAGGDLVGGRDEGQGSWRSAWSCGRGWPHRRT